MEELIRTLQHMKERTERQINAFESGHVKISSSLGPQDETEHYLTFLRRQLEEFRTAIELARARQNSR